MSFIIIIKGRKSKNDIFSNILYNIGCTIKSFNQKYTKNNQKYVISIGKRNKNKNKKLS